MLTPVIPLPPPPLPRQVLLMVDGSYGFEMETFEFLNVLQCHGFPKVMGVLTHLDRLKTAKQLRKTKKELKNRFWTEIYNGAKLFYFSGISQGTATSQPTGSSRLPPPFSAAVFLPLSLVVLLCPCLSPPKTMATSGRVKLLRLAVLLVLRHTPWASLVLFGGAGLPEARCGV